MEQDTDPPGRHSAAPAHCTWAEFSSAISATGHFPDLPVKERWDMAQMCPPGPATGLQAQDKAGEAQTEAAVGNSGAARW